MLKLDWSAYSSNLNSIENHWHILKNMLNMQHPHPSTKEEMAQATQEEWERITMVELLELIDSMRARIEAVIAAQGGHTCW